MTPPERDPAARLPRRVRASHLEPQLREPWSAGSGTPFVAFEGPDEESADGAGSPRVAADFRDGTERGRATTEG